MPMTPAEVQAVAQEVINIQRAAYGADSPPGDLVYQRGPNVYWSPSTQLRFVKAQGRLRKIDDAEWAAMQGRGG